jgi:anaerobic magnesium-protoporphyrin IX monomethyl ester cyclase
MRERYSSDIGHSGGRQIPLGVYYLASYLRRSGHFVSVIDGEAEGISAHQIGFKAIEFKPEIIGISSTTVAFHRALDMAKEIKSIMPEVPVAIGGPHVTAAVDDVLIHPEIDFAIIGEGEVTLSELVDVIKNKGELANVKGLAYRKYNDIIVNTERPFIQDLDSIPFPAYDLISNLSIYSPPPTNYKKLPVTNVITSRGCPNHCTFCGHSVFGRSLRQRSPQNIADEIKYLYHHFNVREIAFVDDTFTINLNRIIELFEILDHNNIHFPWTCMSRVSTVDEQILRFMKEHGCWHISFGIESGNKSILQRIKKNISLEAVNRIINICHHLHIKTKGFFIIGHPGETETTIEETIRFALKLPLDDVIVTLNTPLPGTEQYKTVNQFGCLNSTNWSQYNMWNPVFIPKGLNEEILLDKQRQFYRRFYIRPCIIKRYLYSFFSQTGMRRALSLFRSLPFLFRSFKSTSN